MNGAVYGRVVRELTRSFTRNRRCLSIILLYALFLYCAYSMFNYVSFCTTCFYFDTLTRTLSNPTLLKILL